MLTRGVREQVQLEVARLRVGGLLLPGVDLESLVETATQEAVAAGAWSPEEVRIVVHRVRDLGASLFMGIDPGHSGAIAAVGQGMVEICRLDETERDIWLWVRARAERTRFTFLEHVHAFRGQGVAGTFKFGTSYGFCRGLLIACEIPFTEVTPVKWQGLMGCKTHGDKNVSKARAQQLFPQVQGVIHQTADAMLLAECCRRHWGAVGSGERARPLSSNDRGSVAY